MSETRPLLVLHIGGAKAGSTSIQEFLAVNRQVLAGHGIVVPNTELRFDAGSADQIWYFEKLNQQEDPARTLAEDLDVLCETYAAEMHRRPKQIILSAENLSNHQPANLFSKAAEKYRLQVVLYIRRQEDAYQAAWLQWFVKTGVQIDDWLRETNGYFCDWNSVISRWEALDPEVLSIRIFERELMFGGDVVDDFCALLFPSDISILPSKKDMNVSFGVHVAHLFASLPGAFSDIHDIAFDNVLYRYGIDSAKKRPNEWIFNRSQLDLIRNRHAAGNARIKETYFGNMKRPELFSPVPADAITGIPLEEINRRNIAVLAELLFKSILANKT